MTELIFQITISITGLVIAWIVAHILFGKKNKVTYQKLPPMPVIEEPKVEAAIKQCVHDFKVEGSFKSKRLIRPLNAFHDEFYIDSTVYQKRCKACGWYELDER